MDRIPPASVGAWRKLGLLLVALGLAASPAAAVTGTFELRPSGVINALPPLPPVATFPVQLVLDDDQQEGAFGVAGGNGALQFLWFNQFTPPAGGLTLQEIWVLFPGGANMAVGQSVQLAVYEDPDGDPTNGATLVTSFNATIQAVDDVTFSVYPLPAPVGLSGGDVLIGVINRFVTSGVTPPTSPASLDLTVPQGRSWFALWSGDPPSSPTLPPDLLLARIDDFFPAASGNWMIRGFGTAPAVVEIPTLGAGGLALLALLLALAAAALLRRRRRWGALVLMPALFALAAPAAAQVTVDDFSTAQAALAVTVPPDSVGDTASSNQGGAGMIGGQRDLVVTFDSGGGGGETVSAEVTGGDLQLSVDAGAAGRVEVTWDGDTDPSSLDATGLGGADLTAGGASAFRLNAGATTNPVDAVIEVFTDGANSSVAALVLPVGAAVDLLLPFSEFIPAEGAGADFTDVGAVILTLAGADAGAVVTLFDTVLPALAAAKVDALSNDVDGDSAADPGDTLTYTITITNPGGEALQVDLSDMVDANTTLVGGSVSSTPIAKNDQYVGLGNVTLTADGTPPRVGLLANDADPDGDPITIVAFDPVSARGGTVAMVDPNTGTFDYTPPAGFGGVDSFTYTIEDDDGNAAAGRATVQIDGVVWFVDNSNSGCGSPPCGAGTQADPFQTFKQAEAASTAGDVIRIREGDGTDAGYDQGFILKAGQRLVGGAADLIIGGTLIEAGAGHSVHSHAAGNVLDLAGDHVIEGMRLNPTTGHGIAGTGSSNVAADNVIIYTSGTAGGVGLTNHSGSFTFSNGMITSTAGTTGVAVDITGGSGLFSFAGSSVSHDGGGLIHVENTTGGATVDFTGSNPTLANGTDDGILLTNNTGGASFTFDSIGDVGTGNGHGIRIAGSGTASLDTIGNVSATGGAAVDISMTTIVKGGAPGAVTFASLASTAGAVGVNLNGVAPAVTVNGTTTVNGATGVNLQASGAATFSGQLAVTATAGAGLTANNTGPVTVAANTSTVNATGGPGIDVTSTTVNGTLASVSSSASPGRGLNLDNAGGTLTINGGSITGAAGSAARVNAGAGSFTYAGSVTNAAGRSVEVTNRTGGAVTFAGNLNDTGTGILVQNNNTGAAKTIVFGGASKVLNTGANTAVTLATNTGATIDFTGGGLDIDTSGAATGFNATGGGTFTVQGTGNSIKTDNSAGTGVAVNVASTAFGAAGVTFQRLDVTGAANGIVLASTGASGFFEVTGDGPSDPADTTRGRTTARQGGGTITLGSGGSFTNTSGHSVSLTSATDVRLRNMVLANNGAGSRSGVNATSSTGLTLDNTRITGFSDNGVLGTNHTNLTLQHAELEGNAKSADSVANDEANLKFANLFGTATLANSLIRDVNQDNVRISSCEAAACGVPSPTLVMNVDNVSVRDTLSGAGGNDGILVRSFNDGHVNLTVTGSEFLGNRANGIQHNTNDAGTQGTTTVTGSTFDRNAIAINVAHQGTGTHDFTFTGNTLNQAGGTPANAGNAINVFLAGLSAGTSVLKGTISGNVIGNAAVADSGSTGGDGMNLFASGAGTLTANVVNNTVRGIRFGSAFSATTSTHTGTLNLTLRGNRFDVNPVGAGGFPFAGVILGFGGLAGDTSTMCADLKGAGGAPPGGNENVAFVGDAFGFGAFVNAGAGGTQTLELVGYTGANNNSAQIAAFLDTTAVTVSPPSDASTLPNTATGRMAPCPLP